MRKTEGDKERDSNGIEILVSLFMYLFIRISLPQFPELSDDTQWSKCGCSSCGGMVHAQHQHFAEPPKDYPCPGAVSSYSEEREQESSGARVCQRVG